MRTQNGNAPQLYFNLAAIAINEYANGGRHLDQRMLYEWLQTDTSIMAQYPVLDSFYQAQFVRETEKLVQVDRLIGLLCDSTLRSTPASWHTTLTQAYSTNNSIISDEYFVSNEKWINEMYLNYLEYGLSSIDDDDQDALQTLAFSCPYLAGNAVFKARTLFSMLSPNNYYDDLYICNGQGVYKGGNSQYEQENSLLNTGKLQLQNLVSVFPNPSNGTFKLEYNLNTSEALQVEITDLFGKKILTQQIKGKQAIYTITLPDISIGIYIYSLLDNKGEKYTGKLIIE